MKYSCVIFDCDGVLVDSEPIALRVLAEMANELQVEITEEIAFKEFSGRSLQFCFDYVAKRSRTGLRDTFEEEYREKTFRAFSQELKAVAGVHSLIEKLTIPYCVASGGPMDKIKHNLTITKLLEKFEGRIFSSYEINSWKPEPKIFLHAAHSMGFSPTQCLVIEDSLSGVRAAKAGALNIVGFAHTEAQKAELEKENVEVFMKMEDLQKLICDSD